MESSMEEHLGILTLAATRMSTPPASLAMNPSILRPRTSRGASSLGTLCAMQCNIYEVHKAEITMCFAGPWHSWPAIPLLRGSRRSHYDTRTNVSPNQSALFTWGILSGIDELWSRGSVVSEQPGTNETLFLAKAWNLVG
jgi:hypothetical protein